MYQKFLIPALSLAGVFPSFADTVLFGDTFNRPNSRNIDAVLTGITNNTGSSIPADAVYTNPYLDPNNRSPTYGTQDSDSTNGGGAQIISSQLQLATGTGTSNAFVNHNFVDAAILAAGGFSVSVDIASFPGTSRQHGGAFAIGMSEAGANTTRDAASVNDPSMTGAFAGNPYGNLWGFVAPVQTNIVADFWVALRGDNSLVWGGREGEIQGVSGLSSKTGTITVKFKCDSFAAGATVTYEVFLNGASKGTGSFVWTAANQNYIGLDARDGTGVNFDNFTISTWTPPVAVALNASSRYVEPDDSARAIDLTWTGSSLPSGATYEITASKSVSFPDGNATGSATNSGGSVKAIINGTLGTTDFTITIRNASAQVIATGTVSIQPAGRPNVVVILIDDMGFSDLGCYGGEARTPNIDRLAAEGLRFRNFHNTARCSPTRIALLTGLYTQQAATNPGASLPPLRTDNNITIAEVMLNAGYRTYMAGKWHIGSNTDQLPRNRGFQHVFGIGSEQGGSGADFWKRDAYSFYSTGGEIPSRTYGSNSYDFYVTDAIGDYAVDFVNHNAAKADGGNFFMYLPFTAPHFDIEVDKGIAETAPSGEQSYLDTYAQGWDVVRPARYARMLGKGVIDSDYALSPPSDTPYNTDPGYQPIPAWDSLTSDRKADLARRMALYTAMIERLDANVGRLVDRLKATGQLDNTLIMLLSDNGSNAEGGMFGWARTDSETAKSGNHAPLTGTGLAEMGQPGRDDNISIGGGWANVGNTPFRMYKRYSHEGGTNTPLIVHWPAGIDNPGRWTNQRGHVIDILKTVADVTGATIPAEYNSHAVLPPEGRSLKSAFRDQPDVDRTIGFEHESTRAWIDGHWKLVTKTASSTDGSSMPDTLELYDMSTDPTELHNVARDYPSRLYSMVQAWNAWAGHVGVDESRLLLLPFTPEPSTQNKDLFLDTFSRPDAWDIDESAGGMSGSALSAMGANATYYEGFEGSGEPDSIHINTGRLRMAFGSGMSETGIMHNFVGQDIVSAGGFSVSMRVDSIASSTSDTGRYAGFGVGLTATEASGGGDIDGGNSFRGNGGGSPGKADFFVELDIVGNVKVWRKGTLLATVPVGSNTGTLTAGFALDGFSTTSTVTVTVFFQGRLIDINPDNPDSVSQTFSWDYDNTNYIGLSARATGSAQVDNLAIRELPLSAALASQYATDTGLSSPDSGLTEDPDNDGDDNFTEWLKGGNPAGSDVSRSLLSIVLPQPSGECLFSYHRLEDAAETGIHYAFSYSTNLVDWLAFEPEELGIQPDGSGYETMKCRIPLSLTNDQPAFFMKLDAQASQP